MVQGLGSFGAEPGEVQQGSGELSGECQAALVQSEVRFKRVPEKVPETVLEKVGAVLVQSQVRSNKVAEKVPEKIREIWCTVWRKFR